MFEFATLDVNTPTVTKKINWVADCILVRNFTPYPLYINWRTTTIPNLISKDDIVPAGVEIIIAVKGTDFGFRLDTTGAVSPTIGEQCFITLLGNEVIPTFGEIRWKFIVQNSYTVNGGTPSQSFTMNVSGSQGLLLYFVPNIAFPNTEGGSVLIETSNDNLTYTELDRFILTLGSPTVKTYAVVTPYFRITISRIKGIASGIFNWSLLTNYIPKPVQYQSDMEMAFNANLTNNSNLQITYIGELKVKRIFLSFETPTATPTDYVFTIAITIGLQQRIYRIASNPTFATGVNIIGSDYITYNRINKYAYCIPIDQNLKNGLDVLAVNQSGATLTNVSLGVEVELSQ